MNTPNNNGDAASNAASHATGHVTTGPRLAQFARTRDYWLGGKDNCAIDQEVGSHIAEISPDISAQMHAARVFLARAVRCLASEHQVRQFLDIGLTFPSHDSTHEVAQRVASTCRIVYADHDPVLLAHARALLISHPLGMCGYVEASLHEPGRIIHAASRTLDLGQPVALLLAGVLHHLLDVEAAPVVAELTDALAPGSFVAISHLTGVVHMASSNAAWEYWNEHGTPQVLERSPEEIARFFDGLELLAPGVGSCSRWRPEATPWGLPPEVDEFCGLARKPGGSR